MTPAPLVIIVGFLGAGKTTFIRELLPLLESRGLEPFVIINDYANAKVDASSLVKDGRMVTPINGNCICCDSIIELMNVLLEIPLTEKRLVLIEANGTTDPTALIEHLLVNEDFRRRFHPLLQVGIVDLKRWQKRHWHNELERLQIETASHLLFTREEEVSKTRVAQVRSDIEWFHPKAEWIKRQAFALELEKMVLSKMEAPECETEVGEDSHKGCQHHEHKHGNGHNHEQEHHGDHVAEYEHHHAHQHDHSHDARHALSHAFVGVQIDLPAVIAAEDLLAWLKRLPAEVLRVKGVVQLAEEPDRWYQFQRVDEIKGEARLYELPQKPVVPPCAVLIGVRLDESTIRQKLAQSIKKEATFAA